MTSGDGGGYQYPPHFPPPPGGPYQPPARYEPRRKRKKWPFVLGAVVLVLGIVAAVVIVARGGDAPGPTGTPGAAPAHGSGNDMATVVYEVTGARTANIITYSSNGQGAISQEEGATLPWRRQITIKRSFATPTVTAQSAGSGTISCRITVDGVVVKELSAQGQFAVVACAGEPIR